MQMTFPPEEVTDVNCQEVRLLLSEYLDGEIGVREREMVREHLTACEDCTRELEAFRCAARILSSVEDASPPAGLLERIEAATIGRPTLGSRAREALAPLFRVPAYVGWTAAATAAAALIIGVAIHPTAHQSSGKSLSTRPGVVAKQPLPSLRIVEQPSDTASKAAVAVTRHSHRSSRRLTAFAGSSSSRQSPVKPSAKPPVSQDQAIADTESETPIAPTATEPTSEIASTTSTAQEQPKPEIKLVKSPAQPDWQKKDADALAGLRTKLAEKNKQRRYEVRQTPIEEKQYSLNLASVKF